MRKYTSVGRFRKFLLLLAVCVSVGLVINYSETASSQRSEIDDQNQRRESAPWDPIAVQAVNFAVSPAVRDLPEVKKPGRRAPAEWRDKVIANGGKDEVEKNPLNRKIIKNLVPGAGADGGDGKFVDSLLSYDPKAPMVMPVPTVNFDGLSSADNNTVFGTTFAPPDTVGDVGPNHYVQMTNTLVRIYNKAGAPLVAPFLLSSITSVAGGPCANTDDGDPIVVYDPLADRWLLSQFCVTPVPGHQVIAISKTPDPTGAYFVYDFVHPTSDFQDYPHFGVWPDGYYMTTNQFNQAGTAFLGAGAFAYDRVKMLAGDPTATYIYFNQFAACPTCGGQLPTDLDGTVTPPAGMGNLFMEFRADEFGDPADGLRIFEFKPDYVTPALSTYTQVGAGDLPLAAFDARSPATRSAIEQPGTATGLDAIADRLLFRLAYRNLGTIAAPVNSWVLNFSVNVGGVNPISAGTYQTGIRWAELRRAGAAGAMSVNQQGTQSTNPGNPAGGTNLWMGSVAQDNQGNIVLGYSTSGSTNPADFPSIKYAGRLATDPAGSLAQGEGVGHLGTGFQAGAGSRWGDYSAMSVDPADECSFWYTQEYRTAANNASAFLWNTRVVGGIKFPTCTAPQRGTITGTVTSCSSGLPIANAMVTSPTGFVAYTNAAGQYTIINVPAGTTSVTGTKAGGFSSVTTNNVVVTNGQSTTVNFCLVGVPTLAPGVVSIVSESCLPANNAVDPGETVTVALPVTNTGGANTVNDVGTLQATGGVTSPGGPQNYGVVVAGGAAVSRNFTFTADPQLLCGANITATVAHQDGANNLGNVVYTIPTGATAGAPTTVSYTGPPVPVPDSPAPGVNINLPVAGITGTVADLNFRFDTGGACDATVGNTNAAMDHTFIGDLTFKLTPPDGAPTVTFQARRGGTRENICLSTLDDDGGFPNISTLTSVTGSPQAGNFAPETTGQLSLLDGENPNGTWTLNVQDLAGIDTGSMRRFSLLITPRTCSTNCAAGGAADLSITKTDGVTQVSPGQPLTYTIVATNNTVGTTVTNATVTDTFPAAFTGATWTCSASAGSSCTVANGAGPINTTVTLAGGGTATFIVNGTVSATATFGMSNTATVQPPAGVTDPVPGNNSARDTDAICVPTGGTTVSYTGPPVPVPDSPAPGVNINLPVAGVGTVADLNFRFDTAGACDATVGNTNAAMDHTFVGDLTFRLTPPDGAPTVAFMARRGGTRENICLTNLNDEGGFPNVSTLTSVTGSPIAGDFSPEATGMLSLLDGENANGTWVLNVQDSAGIDTGSMRRFSLIFNSGNAPEGIGGCNPTAAGVTVSGRVTTPEGYGLRNARVTIVDSTGMMRSAITNSFGYYTLDGIEVGGTYVVSVASRRYTFTPRTITVNDAVSDLNFVGQ